MFCFMRESNADYRVSFVIMPFRKAASVFGGSRSSLLSHSRMRA